LCCSEALWHAKAVMSFLYDFPLRRFAFLTLFALSTTAIHAQTSANHLANSSVIIIRHAEKPESGSSLAPAGFIRAEKYTHYFQSLTIDGQRLLPDALYAGADSTDSIRPRQTLEPLSRAMGIPLNAAYSTNEPDKLVHALADEQHGHCILIAWRHKKIAALLKDFGADPAMLLPDSSWPDDVYDWVIVLHFDAAGHVDQQRRIVEPNPLP